MCKGNGPNRSVRSGPFVMPVQALATSFVTAGRVCVAWNFISLSAAFLMPEQKKFCTAHSQCCTPLDPKILLKPTYRLHGRAIGARQANRPSGQRSCLIDNLSAYTSNVKCVPLSDICHHMSPAPCRHSGREKLADGKSWPSLCGEISSSDLSRYPLASLIS